MTIKDPIYVTQPYLPPIEEFMDLVHSIWQTKILTNNGPLHKKLEEELASFLGVKYLSLFSNGTLALITAIQALNLKGEVITSPFSFVATAHSLWWNGLKPVFVDIDSKSYNLDPTKIEKAITKNTSAILPVHVYGNPCEILEIQQIAEKYNLLTIYDAAHAFGVKIEDDSVVNYGDIAILSFHATKVFNTFEGGAIICHNKEIKDRVDQLKNFGIIDETTILSYGYNAKMNEIQAAMGLLQLKHFQEIIERRKKVNDLYYTLLNNIDGIEINSNRDNVVYNYAYYPIRINPHIFGVNRDEIYMRLKELNIFTRRYFYPLISQLPMYKHLDSSKEENLKVATQVSAEILCLPIYPGLHEFVIEYICQKIKGFKK